MGSVLVVDTQSNICFGLHVRGHVHPICAVLGDEAFVAEDFEGFEDDESGEVKRVGDFSGCGWASLVEVEEDEFRSGRFDCFDHMWESRPCLG